MTTRSLTSAFAQWSRRGHRLLTGQQTVDANAVSVAVAVIPALGPLPPVLVGTGVGSDPGALSRSENTSTAGPRGALIW